MVVLDAEPDEGQRLVVKCAVFSTFLNGAPKTFSNLQPFCSAAPCNVVVNV